MSEDLPVLTWLRPAWPAPARVRAASSLRGGGVSTAPYVSLNLGGHVGDLPAAVAENRRRLRLALELPAEPTWLRQVHGNHIIEAGADASGIDADGSWTATPGVVCVVLTADCLPLLLCTRHGSEVAALHCGWRGLAGGVIEAGLKRFRSKPPELIAWLGPAISGPSYEIGEEVRTALMARYPTSATAFSPTRPQHYQADLYALSRRILAEAGVPTVFGGDRCTFRETDAFFSHRRDGATGRMASLIWLES